MKRILTLLFGLLLSATAAAQPVTTKPNASNIVAQCLSNVPVVGAGSGISPICHASGALAALSFVTPGTGVAAALALNVGSAGAPVLFNGALGTPSSGTLTNTTGLPIGTGVSGLGANVATGLAIAVNGAGGFPTYTAGSWTPGLGATTTAGTPTYTTQIGSYEQIGRQVTVRFTITLSGWTGSPAGNVTLTGLPLTSANVAGDTGVCHMSNYVVTGLAASNFAVSAYITPNSTFATMLQGSNTTTSNITTAQAGTTPTFIGMCTYHV